MTETAELKNLIKSILLEYQDPTQSEETQQKTYGIFDTVDEAISAAKAAQLEFETFSLATRKEVIEALRTELCPFVAEYARETVEQTGMGRVEDKTIKNKLALDKTPGVEDLRTEAETGDNGMTLYELSPYGVIGAILPSTNPVATLLNNGIGMLAAGNGVYFSVHPGAKNVSLKLIKHMNKIIEKVVGISNLFTSIAKPSNDAVNEMMQHKDVAILVITGGPGIVRMGLTSGKKTIGAGAGNPPALVDETANVDKAATDIYEGASFDNGILCTAEKGVIAVQNIERQLVDGLIRKGAYLITSEKDIQALVDATIIDNHPNKELIGKNAKVILESAGIQVTGDPKLIILRVSIDHPFVIKEMLMPILPVVSARDFKQAKEYALEMEQNLHHTAVMHSNNIGRMNEVARAMKTSIFVKNGSSFAGLGINGEGPTTFTIATPTGEGTTTARHFTRRRRCVLTDGFSLK